VGGLLEGEESVDFKTHLKRCIQCRTDYEELSGLVTGQLLLSQGGFGQTLAEMCTKPLPGSRQRFLRRARAEGVVFSQDVDIPTRSGAKYVRPLSLMGPVAALVVVAIGLAVYHFRGSLDPRQAGSGAAAEQITELKRQNSALAANLLQSNQSLAARQAEIQTLRARLGNEEAAAAKLRQAAQGEVERSTSQNAQLQQEARNQEKLLAEARDEAARSSQLRIDTEASLVEQQTRITELSNKLRIASATIDMERQLAAAGKDVRELMAARELHVIDVRDTDANGKPADAFGRVFLTEGKSLTFYAFDLNQPVGPNAKRGFEVWAADSGKNSSHSLGFLRADSKAPGRWVLKVDNPELVKQISGVFVTSEPAPGGKEPSTQKMLYAYLGEANHP
jgi:hypothetical protein